MPLVDISRLQSVTAVNLSSDPGNPGGPVVVPQAAQIVLSWVLADGKRGNNVLYGRYTGAFAGTVAQTNSILTALTTGAQWTAFAASIAPTASLANVQIRDVNQRDQAILTSTTAGASGTSTGTELPDEVALCVTLRTSLVGRGNRGRFFIPGFATSAIATGNVVAAATVTATNNWVTTFTAIFAAQGYTWVLGQKHRLAYVSPKTGVSHPERPASSALAVTPVVRDNHWDTIRRRGLK